MGGSIRFDSYQLNNAQIATPVTGTVYTLSDGQTTVTTTAQSNSLEQLVTDLRNADKYSDLTFTISADTGTGSIVATSSAKATPTINAKSAAITIGNSTTAIGKELDSTSYQLNNAQITTPVTGTVYTLSDGLTTVITTAKSNSLEQLVTDLRNADKYSDLTFTISADTGTGSIVATNGENATETINAKNATITTGRIAAESLIDERLGINPQFGAAAIQVRDPGGVLPAYQNELILSAEQPEVLVKENPFEYPYGSTAIAPIYTVPSPTSNAYTYSDNVYWMDWNEDGKLELPLAGSSERSENLIIGGDFAAIR